MLDHKTRRDVPEEVRNNIPESLRARVYRLNQASTPVSTEVSTDDEPEISRRL